MCPYNTWMWVCVQGRMGPWTGHQVSLRRCCSLLPRGCTDIICCVFLLVAIVGYVAVGIIGVWKRGQVWGSRVGGQASGTGMGMVLRSGDAILSLDLPPQPGPTGTLERWSTPLIAEASSAGRRAHTMRESGSLVPGGPGRNGHKGFVSTTEKVLGFLLLNPSISPFNTCL